MTAEQFDNFELRLEWKLTENGNSGIIYRISTDSDAAAGPPPLTRRQRIAGNHVEHWMNGVKLLEYEIGRADWEARVKASKFAKMPWYGRAKRGYIALQDHGNLVTYRNIKLRPLGSKTSAR